MEDEKPDSEYLIHCTDCGIEEDYSGPTNVGPEALCPNEECRHRLVRHTISVAPTFEDDSGNFNLPRFE